MSAPVDVLAVIDRRITECKLREFCDATIAAGDATRETELTRDAIAKLLESAEKAKRAYWLARNSAAGLTNYCPESANSRRCERELDEAERIYRESGFDAAIAKAKGEQP